MCNILYALYPNLNVEIYTLNEQLLTRDYYNMKEGIVVRRNTHSSSISDLIRIVIFKFLEQYKEQ